MSKLNIKPPIELNERNCVDMIKSIFPNNSEKWISFKDVISICGILGPKLHAYGEVKNSFYATLDRDVINVRFSSQIIEKMEVQIDLGDMIIRNQYFGKKISHTESISFYRVLYQTSAAQALGFKKIFIHAVRERKDGTFGYNVWGKYGFTMNNGTQKKRLKYWAQDKNYDNITCISDIYLDDDAKLHWRDEGFSWMGEFKLASNSKSWKILNQVKEALDQRIK